MVLQERVGTVTGRTRWSGRAVVRVEQGELHVGDTIRIRGPGVDIHHKVHELLRGRDAIHFGHAGEELKVRVPASVPREAGVFLVQEDPYRVEDGAVLRALE